MGSTRQSRLERYYRPALYIVTGFVLYVLLRVGVVASGLDGWAVTVVALGGTLVILELLVRFGVFSRVVSADETDRE